MLILILHTWALHVANDASAGIVHELHAHLCDTTTRACTSSDQLIHCLRSHFFPAIHHIPVRPRTRVTFASLTGTLRRFVNHFCFSRPAEKSLTWWNPSLRYLRCVFVREICLGGVFAAGEVERPCKDSLQLSNLAEWAPRVSRIRNGPKAVNRSIFCKGRASE